MPVSQVRSLFIGSLITSFCGFVILLTTDFAGWEEEIAYVPSTIYRTYSINIFSGYFIIIGTLASGLAYATFISYIFLRVGDTAPNPNNLRLAFYGATAVAAASLIAGILFLIVLSIKDPVDWWLDTGFYAGLIGGGSTALLLRLGLKSIEKELD